MCGIAGVVEAHPDPNVLRAMSDLLAHRGPDGSGLVVRDERVGLAHRRLAIIDLTDTGAQPMSSASGTEIIFNGEIYNYIELRGELADLGATFHGESDTEVLLAAYDQWGSDCLSRLNGMFAFAIYDPGRRVLFAARDRFGEKPFYYHTAADGTFVFASELKALFVHPSVPRRADMDSVYRFLRFKEADREPQTFFADIQALPAGHSLTLPIDGGRPSVEAYWSLVDRPVSSASRSDLVERFGALLGDSIRLRLRSDVPVGSSLSGGLDSSAIVGYIARACGIQQQHTFSARFPDSVFDEGRYIADVVGFSGAQSHEVAPEPSAEDFASTVWHLDQPFLSLSIYAQWSVMRLAQQSRITVLLDGQGADEMLGGYHFYLGSHYRALFQYGRWLRLVREARQYAARNGSRRLAALAYYGLPENVARQAKRFVRRPGIARDFVAEHGRLPPAQKHLYGDPLRHALHATLTRTMLPTLLRQADRNSMAFSREVRLPFLDHRLVELAFDLPSDLKVSGATTKVVLRRAMADFLPASVLGRYDKIGYAPPQAAWLRGPLRDLVGDALHSQAFIDRPWTDVPYLQQAWDKLLAGESAYEGEIARALSLELWAQRYLDPGSWS